MWMTQYLKKPSGTASILVFPIFSVAMRRAKPENIFGEMYTLAANPGEYEFKLLWNNRLARSIKFTVQPGGKFDNGIATTNKLGNDRVIVPVQIIGEQEGAWDRAPWKTAGFYGNPLTGFSALP
jgi:hypothetical protein